MAQYVSDVATVAMPLCSRVYSVVMLWMQEMEAAARWIMVTVSRQNVVTTSLTPL